MDSIFAVARYAEKGDLSTVPRSLCRKLLNEEKTEKLTQNNNYGAPSKN
jgi:hypothetical protein